MKRVKETVTLKDIALQTGYSVNTVSRALRGKDDISEKTIEKIKQAANSMGYINNTIASSLRLGYTNTIAVILGDISNPHFAIMTKEIENHARTMGYSTFLLNTNEDAKLERAAIRTAINKNVDGIIICPTQEDSSNIQFLIDSKIPFVQIGRHDGNLDANYVVCDDVLGGYQATKFLIDNGHKKILFLNGPSYISSARERKQGYLKALREAGIPEDGKLIREISVSRGNCSEVLEAVLKEQISFSAVFAFSDMIAWETCTFFDRKGMSVPKDISVVGFDHIQSRIAIPSPLATISSFKGKMSVTAVECLKCKMNRDYEKEGHESKICHHVLTTKLVPGESVRNIAKQDKEM